jgi:thermitase
MPYFVSTPLIVTALGLTLVAWEATRSTRNPLLALGGFVLVGFGVASRLLSGAPVVANVSGVFMDFGVGFLVAGALLIARKASATSFIAIGVTALLVGGGLKMFAGSPAGEESANATDVQLLVELGADDDISEIAPLLAEFGARFERAFPRVSIDMDVDLAQVFVVTVPAEHHSLVDRLKSLLTADEENIDYVEFNRTVTLVPPPETAAESLPASGKRRANDPLAASQWAFDASNIDGAHEILSRTEPVRKAIVAILDTGVDAQHEDIRSTFLNSPADDDVHGHGTHCAGIAGAATNNGVGMASLNWEGKFVEVASYRALSSSGMGTVESIAQAVIDATSDGADIISMSLGDYSPTPPRVIREAIGFAQQRDVIVVAAAGNSNQDAGHHMPANIDGVIAVSAIDASLRKAAFSNTNVSLKRPIAAPGVDILSLVPKGGYETKSGTSMATPLVAGLLGTMRALDPGLTAEKAYDILHATGREVEDSRQVGRVIDAGKAIAALVGPGAES